MQRKNQRPGKYALAFYVSRFTLHALRFTAVRQLVACSTGGNIGCPGNLVNEILFFSYDIINSNSVKERVHEK